MPDPSNPQSFNRFAAMLNNPLTYIDPSGHRACRNKDDCAESGETPNGMGHAPVPGVTTPVQPVAEPLSPGEQSDIIEAMFLTAVNAVGSTKDHNRVVLWFANVELNGYATVGELINGCQWYGKHCIADVTSGAELWEVKPDNDNWRKGQGKAQHRAYAVARNANGKLTVPGKPYNFVVKDGLGPDLKVRPGTTVPNDTGMLYYSRSPSLKKQSALQVVNDFGANPIPYYIFFELGQAARSTRLVPSFAGGGRGLK